MVSIVCAELSTPSKRSRVEGHEACNIFVCVVELQLAALIIFFL